MSSPLHPRDLNAPTPTTWFKTFDYIPHSTPIRNETPPPLCTPDSHTKRVKELADKIVVTMEALMRPADETPQQRDPQEPEPDDGPLVAGAVEENVTPNPCVDAAPQQLGSEEIELVEDDPLVAVEDDEPLVVKVCTSALKNRLSCLHTADLPLLDRKLPAARVMPLCEVFAP